MPTPRMMSRSGCSAWRVAPDIATRGGVRSCMASTPVPNPSEGAAAPAAASTEKASGPTVSAVQKDW